VQANRVTPVADVGAGAATAHPRGFRTRARREQRDAGD
jgi:hypothetical protein